MFPYSIETFAGIAILDHARRAKLAIQPMTSRPVMMANGQTMRVYGTMEFILQILEWRGRLQPLYWIYKRILSSFSCPGLRAEALRQHLLYARPLKCTFDKPEVEFRSHVVGGGVVRVLDKKVKIIREWPQPKNIHEVLQFFGLANCYRRFIRNFGQIGAPLAALFK